MRAGNILVILACLVAGYAIVSVLMKTNADDLRPPPKPGNPPPPASPPQVPPQALPPPTPAAGTMRTLKAPQAGNWSLILDIPRSASPRDIEAAFRRQQGKAQADGDHAMIERLRLAREAALAEKKNA